MSDKTINHREKDSVAHVSIKQASDHGMILLRGDFTSDDFNDALVSATGLAIPSRRCIVGDGNVQIAWMSPDELLVLMDWTSREKIAQLLEEALKDQRFLLADVSDSRAIFDVEGKLAREVIAKLCPVDMHPDAFLPGEIRRTRLAQASAAIWMTNNHSVKLICFRSFAEYVFHLLKSAAKPGSEINVFDKAM